MSHTPVLIFAGISESFTIYENALLISLLAERFSKSLGPSVLVEKGLNMSAILMVKWIWVWQSC